MFWLIDTSWDWTPYLHLGVAQLPFNGAHLGLTVCYSILSFLVWLGVFWIWISCFFSLGKGSGRDGPAEAWMRTQLGWTARLPTFLKVTLPGACLGGVWWALRPCMVRANMLPPLISPDQAWQEAVLVGCATLPHWLGAMAAALFLEGLSTYFVLGYSPLLDCAKAAANRMRPLWAWIPAQWGALELRPFVGALLLALAALGMRFGLERLFFHKVTGGG
ncbi:MAG: hypothetical protein J7M29_09675 [Verrucomicrobia bacterium]|nr:hypothetical protein [Verrucomicrobiota bacterium]